MPVQFAVSSRHCTCDALCNTSLEFMWRIFIFYWRVCFFGSGPIMNEPRFGSFHLIFGTYFVVSRNLNCPPTLNIRTKLHRPVVSARRFHLSFLDFRDFANDHQRRRRRRRGEGEGEEGKVSARVSSSLRLNTPTVFMLL